MKALRVIILALAASYTGVSAQDVPPFANCSVDVYYAELFATKGGPANWTFEDVSDLVSSTQRYSLNSTSTTAGGDDIFAALRDLDEGVESDLNVLLLYRNIEVPKIPAGTPQSWVAERLFPIFRGATLESGAANDVFNIKPADTSVLLARQGRLFFGECGTVENISACVSPATPETASDTAADGKIITPPKVSRGDVARSIFYMALRYFDLGLVVGDCPPFEGGEFGYLSPLLNWHKADNVTDLEIARNDKACERWQGNRNPLIDFPELVPQFFGVPDVIREGTTSFSRCTDETESPTATPNACSSIKPGDAMVFSMKSDEPDQVIFFPLAGIPEIVGSLYLTDNAWDGEKLTTAEGTIEFNIPEGGIIAGNIFGYGDGSPFSELWEDPEGLFDLSVTGDQFFLYCLDADEEPHFISGFSYNGEWTDAEDLADPVPLDKSALPEDLIEFGSVALPHIDNYLYRGSLQGSRTDLLAEFMDPVKYEGYDDAPTATPTSPPTAPPTAPPTSPPNACSSLKGGDAMVFLVNSDEPDQVVFFPLTDIPDTVGSLYLTDNSWDGEKLASNEGAIRFTIPEGGITAGDIFGYGEGSPLSEQWGDAEGFFDLSVTGDQFFLYCLDVNDLPNFISGFSFNGDWADAEDIAALDEVPLDQSALPDDLLEFGSVALPHADNHIYIGSLMGSEAELLAEFMDPANYKASDDVRYGLETSGALSLFSALFTAAAIIPLAVALLI